MMNDSHGDRRRVVITGVGLMSPLGIRRQSVQARLLAGESGIGPLTLMQHSAAPRNVGAEVRDFDEREAKMTYLQAQRKSLKVMCREIILGVASANLALEDAGIDLATIDHDRLGVDFGANLMFSPPDVLKDACWNCTDEERRFHYEQWGDAGFARMEPLWLLKYLPNMPACHIGIAADARGPSNSITLDEASGNLALGEAQRLIERNAADVMIAGTTGTRLHPVKTLHAALWDDLAESDGPPETWCRPFDAARTGQVLGEGACTFILEAADHAERRGANVLAHVLGSGSSCVRDTSGRPGLRKALAGAMRAALRDAGLSPHEIGHVNAHGMGSIASDIEETRAIHDVFGPHAAKVPVTGLKSYFGNSGSGCGTLELAGSILALREGVVPKTLNLATPDPQCPLSVVRGEHLPTDNPLVLSINVTRMGQASALVVRVVK
ncbi:MAG: beta-ketoacyl-[acyl-carrier-protein] synthase family protein [Planctomycetaceae bacterium]